MVRGWMVRDWMVRGIRWFEAVRSAALGLDININVNMNGSM